MKLNSSYVRLGFVFLAGLLLGLAFSRPCPFPPMFGRPPHGPPPPPSPEMLLERLSRDVGLDEKQRNEVRPLIVELDSKLSKIRNETTPKVEAAVQESAEKARPFLSAQQQEDLKRIFSRIKERRDGPPGGPPPPPPF